MLLLLKARKTWSTGVSELRNRHSGTGQWSHLITRSLNVAFPTAGGVMGGGLVMFPLLQSSQADSSFTSHPSRQPELATMVSYRTMQ